MNYAALKKFDIANGPGVRVSLFVSGCRHRCKNCFNSEAWDFSYGKPFTDEVENEILTELGKDYIMGLSLKKTSGNTLKSRCGAIPDFSLRSF